MLNGSLMWNGVSSDTLGIKVERIPDLRRPARKFNATSVHGRNGNLYELQDAWEEVEQSYQIYAGSDNGDSVISFGAILEWLHSADDYAVLSDSYDSTHYRLAVYVDALEVENSWNKFGRTIITFRCRPERYIIGSPVTIPSVGTTVTNTTNHIAKPVINLTGYGTRNMLQLGNKTLKTDDVDGVMSTGELYNFVSEPNKVWMAKHYGTTGIQFYGGESYTYGNIVSLDEATGAIEYTITGSSYSTDWGLGFIFAVEGDTDYTLSCEAYDGGILDISFGDASGYNSVISHISQEVAGSSWVTLSQTFHTPPECGYIFIIFAHKGTSTPGATSQKFQNIMLVTGTTARTFREYGTDNPIKFTINDTTLTFTASFDDAVIDCESENFTLNGVDANQLVAITDAYGNPSTEFLQLKKGSNAINRRGQIWSASMDTRFWEL